jgi:predicted HicB family RNase H-like nuclease
MKQQKEKQIRDKRIYARCTPETLENIKRLAAAAGISIADWIERAVAEAAPPKNEQPS